MYRKILINIQKYAKWPLYPRLYLYRPDLLVLEDLLSIRQDLKMMHFNESTDFTCDNIKLFLTHLAEMHVSSLEWQHKEHIDVLKDYSHDTPELLLSRTNKWYLVGIKVIQ